MKFNLQINWQLNLPNSCQINFVNQAKNETPFCYEDWNITLFEIYASSLLGFAVIAKMALFDQITGIWKKTYYKPIMLNNQWRQGAIASSNIYLKL